MRRRPNTQVVQWFLELHARGQLDLDPPFQRRSVWSPAYRRYYVETVLRDLPSPSIYLQVEQRPDLPTLYHVIDGKQRLESLLGFARDEFHLGQTMEGEGLASHYYSDLPNERKIHFSEYVLNVENISSASEAELIDAFDRLNRNVARLTPQELRHAKFDGRFATKMPELADRPFWSEIGVSTKARVRRMADVEFVSELYLLTMHGVQDGNDEVLDQAYADYDAEIPDEELHDERFQQVLDLLRGLPLPWRESRWKNQADLYSLWAAGADAVAGSAQIDLPQAAARLMRLHQALADPAQNWDEAQRRYSDAVRQGSNKDTNRRLRAVLLQNALTGKPASASIPS